MHFKNFKRILAASKDIMIKFNPESQGGQLRTWELGQRTEIQAIQRHTDEVNANEEKR